MAQLKLGPLIDEKPVRLNVELPAKTHRDLVDYGAALAAATGESVAIEPAKLIAPMLERFMASDRGFAAARRQSQRGSAPRE